MHIYRNPMHKTASCRCTRQSARLFASEDFAIVLEVDIFITHIKQFGRRKERTQVPANNFLYSIHFSILNELFFVLHNCQKLPSWYLHGSSEVIIIKNDRKTKIYLRDLLTWRSPRNIVIHFILRLITLVVQGFLARQM